MSFNTILGPTKLNTGTSDTDPASYPAVTTLSNGSFAVSYEVIQVGSSESSQIVSEIFNGQGQLVQETFASPLPHFSQFDTDVAGLSGGGYALAWTEPVFNASGTFLVFQIFTAVYDNAGNQLSVPVSVDPAPATVNLTVPQVTALSSGGYVVSWLKPDNVQVGSTDIMVGIFDSTGHEVVAPINITNSPGVPDSANFLVTSVVGLASGGFALTWTTSNSDFDHDVYTAIYDAQGQQVLAPLNVTQTTGIDENLPQITVLTNGNYALTWDGVTDPAGFAQPFTYTAVFDAQGNQIAGPSVMGPGQIARSAALTNGDYAVMWSDGVDIFTAVYNGQGTQIVAPLTVSSAPGAFNSATGGVTALANGAYALVWHAQIADGSFDIFTAVYDSQGHQLVAPVNVSNSPGVDDSLESVDARGSANGSYAITWQGPGSGSGFPAEYLAIYQFADNQSVGNVNIVGSPDINIDLSAVINVGGDVIVTNNGNLITIDLHNLANVGGNFVIGNNGALLTITLPSLATVTGSVDVSNNDGATTVGLDSLTTVNGSVSIENNSAAGSVDLGSLTSAGSVDISNNTGATTIGLGSLTTVTGSVSIENNSAAGSVDLGRLESAGGAVSIGGNTAAGSVDLGSLTSAGSVDISNNTGATTIGLGSLTTVGGSVNVSGNTSVTTIDLGALVQAGAVVITDNGVVTLDLSALVTAGGQVSISNNHSLLSVDMPELTGVGGDLVISGNTAATLINASSLTTVSGNAEISNNSSAGLLDLSSLDNVGGNLVISENTAATLINASSLTTVSGNAEISNNDSVGVLDLSGLESVGGNLEISGNTAATVVDASSLTTVDGNLDINGNDSATVVDATSLTTVSGNVTIDLSPDATVDASALGPGGGSVHVIGDDGRDTTVILGSLAQMGGILTITTADGVALTSAAGLGTITLTGTAAGNTLIGSATAKNVINAGAGNDTASGGSNDDVFTGGAGDDTLDGRGGVDTAVYSGNFADYSIVRHADGSLTVTDTRGNSPDGTDTLRNVELFQFADGVRTLTDLLPAPVITSNGGGDSAQVAIDENTTAVTLVAASNPNAVPALEFTIAGGADAGKFQIDKLTGALSFVTAPDFEHRTDTGGDNVYDVVVQVSDGFHVDTQALAVSVANVNESPTVSTLARSISEDAFSFTQDLLAGASDPDAGTQLAVANLDETVTTSGGRTLTLGVDYTLNGATLALTAAGFAKFNDLGATQSDQAVFHFGASDGFITTPNALTLTVGGANDAPTLTHQTEDQTAAAATPFSLTLPADTFKDVDSGDHLTLTATLSNGAALPAWLGFNPVTGAFSGTPGAGDGGSFDIKVTATDPGGLTAADVFHFTVSAPAANHAPVITSDLGGETASVIITDETRYVATVHATDPDPGTTITYSIVGGADQKLFAIDPRTGVLTFKNEPHEGRAYNVAVAASDGVLQDTQAIRVQVPKGPLEFGNTGVADTFEFRAHFGLAVVNNFDATSPSHDVLEFDHNLFCNANPNASPTAVFDLIQDHSFQFGHNVIIVTDTHDVIDVRNTNLHSLTPDDFILV